MPAAPAPGANRVHILDTHITTLVKPLVLLSSFLKSLLDYTVGRYLQSESSFNSFRQATRWRHGDGCFGFCDGVCNIVKSTDDVVGCRKFLEKHSPPSPTAAPVPPRWKLKTATTTSVESFHPTILQSPRPATHTWLENRFEHFTAN